jgi:glycosyltransferase involved in cell wall biosynthesis
MIPNGFDPAVFFSDKSAAADFRARHALNLNDKLVGLIARNHPAKDLPTFVQTARRVWERRKDVHFLLVGGGLGDEHSVLRQLVAQSECADRFLILDETSDLRGIYSSMDVFCLTSKSEAFPNVLGEAMFCGVPCVTTDVGDAATIVGEHGRVAKVGDSTALAAGVLSILDMGIEQYRALSQFVRERAVRKYSLDQVAEQYAKVCRESMQVRS